MSLDTLSQLPDIMDTGLEGLGRKEDIGLVEPRQVGVKGELWKGIQRGVRNLGTQAIATAEEIGSRKAGRAFRRRETEQQLQQSMEPAPGKINQVAGWIGEGIPEGAVQIGSQFAAAALSGGASVPAQLAAISANVGVRSYGMRKKELRSHGATEEGATIGALLSLPIEIGSEYALGAERMLRPALRNTANRFAKNVAKDTFGSKAVVAAGKLARTPTTWGKRVLKGGTEEAFEEMISLAGNTAIDGMITGEMYTKPGDYVDTFVQSFFTALPMVVFGASIQRHEVDKAMGDAPSEQTLRQAYMRNGEMQDTADMDFAMNGIKSALVERFGSEDVEAAATTIRNVSEHLASMDDTKLPQDFVEGITIALDRGEVDMDAWRKASTIKDARERTAAQIQVLKDAPSFGEEYYRIMSLSTAAALKEENDATEKEHIGATEQETAELMKNQIGIPKDAGPVFMLHAYQSVDQDTFKKLYLRGKTRGVEIAGQKYTVYARGVAPSPGGAAFMVKPGDLVFVLNNETAPEVSDTIDPTREARRKVYMDQAAILDADSAYTSRQQEIQKRIDEGVLKEEEAAGVQAMRDQLELKRQQGRAQVEKFEARRAQFEQRQQEADRRAEQRVQKNIGDKPHAMTDLAQLQDALRFPLPKPTVVEDETPTRNAQSLADLAKRTGIPDNAIAQLPRQTQERMLADEEYAQEISAAVLPRLEIQQEMARREAEIAPLREEQARVAAVVGENAPPRTRLQSEQQRRQDLRDIGVDPAGWMSETDTTPHAWYDPNRKVLHFLNTATADDIVHEWFHHITETTDLMPPKLRDALYKEFGKGKEFDAERAVQSFLNYLRKTDVPANMDQGLVAAYRHMKNVMAHAVETNVSALSDTTLQAFSQMFGMTAVDQTFAKDGQALASRTAQAIAYTPTEGDLNAEPKFSAVYHSTPHVWAPEPGFPHGRPRLDKIFSKQTVGQGAWSYGAGWYSADLEEVALGNVAPLAGFEIEGVDRGGRAYVDGVLDADTAAKALVARIADKWDVRSIDAAWIRVTEENLSDRDLRQNVMGLQDVDIPALRAAILGFADRVDGKIQSKQGSLYTLDIPDDVIPKLLDWDARPDGAMLERVRRGLYEQMPGATSAVDAVSKVGSGGELYNLLANTLGSKQAASELLARAGIPGNKYLDQGSRLQTARMGGGYRFKITPMAGGQFDVSDPSQLFNPKAQVGVFDTRAEAEAALQKAQDEDAGRTRNYVIWDQPTLDRVALLERNGEKLEAIREEQEFGDARFSATPEQDAAYMQAVEAGDVETQQRMVDEAAMAAGYTQPAYHVTTAPEFSVFRDDLAIPSSEGIYFWPNREDAESMAAGAARVMPVMLRMGNTVEVDGIGNILRGTLSTEADSATGSGMFGEEIAVFRPEQIKSAEPVTRDDQGNVIPLSQRFQPEQQDIRFSATPTISRQDARKQIHAILGGHEAAHAAAVKRFGPNVSMAENPPEGKVALTDEQMATLARELGGVSETQLKARVWRATAELAGMDWDKLSDAEKTHIRQKVDASIVAARSKPLSQAAKANLEARAAETKQAAKGFTEEVDAMPVGDGELGMAQGGMENYSFWQIKMRQLWDKLKKVGSDVYKLALSTRAAHDILTFLAQNNPNSMWITKFDSTLYRANIEHAKRQHESARKIDALLEKHGLKHMPYSLQKTALVGERYMTHEQILALDMIGRGKLLTETDNNGNVRFTNRKVQALFESNGYALARNDAQQFIKLMQDASKVVEGDEQLKGLRGLMDDYFVDILQQINAMREKMGNKPIGDVVGYFPMIREGGMFWNEDSLGDAMSITPRKADARRDPQRSHKQRKGGLGAPVVLDALSVFNQYRQQADIFLSKELPISMLQDILNSPELVQSMVRKGLTNERAMLYDLIESERHYNGRSTPFKPGELAIRAVGSRYKTAVLALNLPSIIRQSFSAPVAVSELPAMASFNIAKNMLHNGRVVAQRLATIKSAHRRGEKVDLNFLAKDPTWQMMVKGGSPHTLSRHDPTEVDIEKALRGKSKLISEGLMMPQRIMDQITRVAVWKAAYDHKNQQLQRAGKTQTEAHDEAFAFADSVTSLSQPAANMSERAMVQKGNEYVRSLVPFTGQLFKFWNMAYTQMYMPTQAAYRAGKQQGGAMGGFNEAMKVMLGTSEAKEKYGINKGVTEKVFFAYVVPAMAMSFLARGGPPKDWKEFWGDLFAYNISMVPIVGPAISAKLLYDRWNSDTSPLFIDILNDFAGVVASAVKGEGERMTKDGIRLAAQMSGVPNRLVKHIREAYNGDYMTNGEFDLQKFNDVGVLNIAK